MKLQSSSRSDRVSGFTVAEMGISLGVLGLLGLVFFQVLNSGLILFAKNTATNAAHEEARQGINRLTRDIHAAVSVPQLRDTNFSVVSSKPVNGVIPTAAGVSFQNVAGGPNYVWKDPNNSSLIMIRDDKNTAIEGMRLIIPFYNLEEDITKVTASGSANHRNIFIKADQSTPQIDAPPVGGTYCITYYTDRVMYVVQNGQYVADAQGGWILSSGQYVPYTSGTMQRYRYENGELCLYRQRYNGSTMFWQLQGVVARFISSPKPFFVPLNSGGTPNNKYVGVKLTAHDPATSNRRYRATSSLLETQIDYRSRIALYQ
jgi:hypothetical protein